MCDNKAMPDDNSGESVEQHPMQEGPGSEAVNPPPPPNNPPSPPTQSVTDKGVESAVHAIEDRVKRAEWLMIGLTAAIALSAIGGVIVGILQWSAMRGQLSEMKSGGVDTHNLAVAAGKQADKSETISFGVQKAADQIERSANAADRAIKQGTIQAQAALNAAISASRLDQRPWVTINRVILSSEVQELKPGIVGDVTINFLFSNTGKTPALDVVTQAMYLLTPVSALPMFPKLSANAANNWFPDPDASQVSNIVVLPPNNTSSAHSSVAFKYNSRFPAYGEYRARQVVIGLLAKLRYKDTFGRPHWTTYCAYHLSGDALDQFEFCSGNDVDRDR